MAPDLSRLRLVRRAAAGVLIVTLSHAAPVEYPAVVRGHTLSFPQDEGAHPAFRTEWWYVTGWVETDKGEPLGFQITFFRTRPGVDEDNPSRFAARQLLFAHAAISDPRRGRLLRDEKSARAGFGLAEAKEGGLDVHVDDWALRKEGAGYRASVKAREFGLELALALTQPPLLHGDRGFSQKGPDPALASYYYSLPQLQARGRIVREGREQAVAGVAWLDHEWMSTIMGDAAQGWDWTGLNFDDGGALAILQMRNIDGEKHWAFATRRNVGPDSLPRAYAPEEIEWTPLRFWRSPLTGVQYPIAWKITVGERTIELRPLMDDQEHDARGSTGTLYWEGAVRAFDERGEQIGRGYLELTGYGSRLKF
jgi:predicted secreted hydrolase